MFYGENSKSLEDFIGSFPVKGTVLQSYCDLHTNVRGVCGEMAGRRLGGQVADYYELLLKNFRPECGHISFKRIFFL